MPYGYYQPYWKLNTDELEHHGILGQKWGIRRYQNKDGTLTEAGKKKLQKYKDKEYTTILKDKARFEDTEKRVKSNREKKGIKQDPRDAAYVKSRLEMYNKELAGIMSMSYSDMKAEKMERTKSLIRSLLYQPIAISQVYTEDKITNMRIDRADRNKKK